MTSGEPADFAAAESALLGEAGVARAVVAERGDGAGGTRLVAWIVPDDEALRAAHDYESSRDTTLKQWAAVFDLTYGRPAAGAAPDFRGWNSSYTGAPIPEAEMEEWVGQAVDRIGALEPGRILEIGCGGGLLLRHLARGRAYTGTDISGAALDRLRSWLAGEPELSHVRLLRRDAADLDDLGEGEFDTVVLNSVAQYFPDGDYLLGVIRSAVRVLSPSGRIFFGDLRHLALTRMFQTSVHLHKAAPDLPVRELRRRIERSIANDRELTVDPRFFAALASEVDGIASVDVELKGGRADNELIRYRYDAVVRLGPGSAPAPPGLRLEAASPAALAAAIEGGRPGAAVVRGIANARLARDAAAVRLLGGFDGAATVGELRDAAAAADASGEEPEAYRDLARAKGYVADIAWTAGSRDGRFDVALRAPGTAPSGGASGGEAPPPWRSCLGNPLLLRLRQGLAARLREASRARLPAALVPSAILLVDSLPLGPDGAVDRAALPMPD